MNSSVRTRRTRWPAIPRRAARRPARAPILLSAEQWRGLSRRLGENRPRTKRLLEAMLWILYTGNSWNALGRSQPKPDAVRGLWRSWLLDGRWVDFWMAYVSLLTPRERARWLAALSAPSPTREASHRTWRLVSARLLLDRI